MYVLHVSEANIVPLTNSFQLTSISPHDSANVTFSLTCNSSGGPVQSMEWMRDGFPRTGEHWTTGFNKCINSFLYKHLGCGWQTTRNILLPDPRIRYEILSSMAAVVNGTYLKACQFNAMYFRPSKIPCIVAIHMNFKHPLSQ